MSVMVSTDHYYRLLTFDDSRIDYSLFTIHHKRMASASKKFSITIKVKPEHLDASQHVNNVIYVQWMQDIATMHWQAFASQQLQQDILWVVRHHEIDYYNQAFLEDDLQMNTWTGDHSNITWKRHYEIIRPADGKKIISAVSVWIPLESKTQKPLRINEALINLFMH